MPITKAKKIIELSKDNRKILVTVYDNQVSSCVEMEAKKYCESCQCDEKTCGEWIEYLKGKGYSATEVALGELGLEESLPKFLEERIATAKPEEETSQSAISETHQSLP